MDIIILLGAMLLAYGGIILLYYRIRSNERKNRISNFLLKGTLSMRRGNMERALFYFNKAYEYSMNDGNKANAAEALYNIGQVYKETGDMETALKYWNESNTISFSND